ncbi:hexose kinase [Bacillus sp. FJAT-50079]|uniref:hexose kinase n=1 Tax=Bacillus sp. FJAT-50079 TaxID=2833577 RepID=UPI001BC95752|nr:hexose kinase [Bacillus sp. FJAT-50079]MBS4206893.1 hexose kinase [Bacillus sp. FJAT-50079]
MILTVTLNPSVDMSYKLDQFSLDAVNRASDVSKTAGGKGLNVSRVLRQLNEDVAATGFLGGNLGDFIRKEITKLGINDLFEEISGATRNCIAVIHEGKQTEILEGGPEISNEEATAFLGKFKVHAHQAELITISGSLPKGLPAAFYEKILDIAAQKGTPALLDTSGKSLECALKGKNKPFLIKPNKEELVDLVGGGHELLDAINAPIFHGIPWVVVTLGAEGAIVKNDDKMYRVRIPKVKAINPVGSGDSVIAGFAAGLSRKLSGEELIKFGLSMGVLNALEEKTGHINPEKLNWCIEQMQVDEINTIKLT